MNLRVGKGEGGVEQVMLDAAYGTCDSVELPRDKNICATPVLHAPCSLALPPVSETGE